MPSPATPADIVSVSALCRRVREALEASFPLCWVGGEISNLTFAASGHVYFTLKDADAQARCVMWRSRAQTLGWRPENGQKVEVRALVSFYEARGEFQLAVEGMRQAGQGDLYERFLRLKARLEAEGLFAAGDKRPLPAFPQALAIVTSLQAAALRDVIATLRRRAPHIRIDIHPAPVQGDGAGLRIAAAVTAAAAGDCAAIILCRGGGSLEDLWAFNDEAVARAIRASRLPVISGVGHETDFTIADFAADVRAPTPTAAAELATPDRDALLARLDNLQRQAMRQIERQIAGRAQTLDWLATRIRHPAERLRERREGIALLASRLNRAVRLVRDQGTVRLASLAHRQRHSRPDAAAGVTALRDLQGRLARAARVDQMRRSGKLNALDLGLIQLDPQAVLRRGYAIAFTADGRAVRDAATLACGDSLNLALARGTAAVSVTQVVAPEEAQ
ncbi:MAG: exodeoxyribonuclease VII large subunit [Betaproteobacteria bacterium]|nr:exodeoxyribonuclease VII large subunit [Betaproteobacteria bacterium]